MNQKQSIDAMRKIFLGFCVLCFCTLTAFSQSVSIKGSVTDSVEKKNLVNSVVSVLTQGDSVLTGFARVDKQGNFSITSLKDGKYILMITHPYMGDYFDKFEMKDGKSVELGNIYLTPKAKLLQEVIVKSGSPIKIKGDTTIYTADSFKVRQGANVEELLRRLPGIQVDKDGKITAMGEQVKKVLVDGEEFFGSDPGIATKNLRADAVSEVQVFDKKSDQAEFTGIDDGVKDKTINLKMKKKEGYFGKISVGGGLPDKYNNAAMINKFKNKQKLAAYGTMGNVGQTQLDWNDAQNYGGGIEGLTTTDDGGAMFIGGGDEDNYWNGQGGIPINWNGGLHYSDKFGKDDKQSFNSGYKFSKINSPAQSNTFSKIFLPDTSWNTNSTSSSFNSTIKHQLNLTMDFNLDSFNSLKWTNKINNKLVNKVSNYYTESLNNDSAFINNSARNTSSEAKNNAIASSLLWRHKFKKLSRTLSINTDFNWAKTDNTSFLYSVNKYYLDGSLSHVDTTNQQNVQDNENKSILSKIAYTEPITKDFYLEASYSFGYYNNSNDRITNFKDNNGKYSELIDSLSNSYVFNRLVNMPGLNFRMNKKKYNYSFGTSVAFSDFTQKNITTGKNSSYTYTNFFPSAAFTYKFKSNENFRFNYNGSTNAPSLEQLQPIPVNTDPLNVYVGNPNLNQSFRHSFYTNYGFYNVLKGTNLWSSINGSFTQNAFVNSSLVDSVGKRTYQTVNANGVHDINFNMEYGFKIMKLDFSFGPTAGISRNIDFINGVRNMTDNTNYGARISLRRYIENKWNFYIGPRFSWVKSKASVNSAANADYWQLEGWGEGNVTLPKKFELHADMNMQIRQKDPRFTQNNSFTKINGEIIKRFFKGNDLELKFGVYDILNQNRGYERNFDSSSFTETYYTTLRRYWLFTITWNISKNGKPSGF
ncbi:MAG: outer membrane beta-barrel family protein [Chitinophagaceae bacterium]